MIARPWPEAALTLLDTLWALDTHHAVIKRKLAPMLPFEPTYPEIREMANRARPKAPNESRRGPKPSIAQPQPLMEAALTRHLTLAPPPRPDNPVRRVEPGTFKAAGFTMIGRRG